MYTLYDLADLAAQAGVSPAQLRELDVCVRDLYGSDDMMVELRLLRTLRAIRDGAVSADGAIREFRPAQAVPAP